jgi:hypothetical protein
MCFTASSLSNRVLPLVLWLLAWAGKEIGTFCSLERVFVFWDVDKRVLGGRSMKRRWLEVALKRSSKGRCTIGRGNDWLLLEESYLRRDRRIAFQCSPPIVYF